MGERKTIEDASDWYLIADHGDMVVRVSPGMLIGELPEGELTLFDRSHAQFEVNTAADGGLLLSAVNDVELEVAGGARCQRAELAPRGKAQIRLTQNLVHLSTNFADLRQTDDTVQIRAVPNAGPNAEPPALPHVEPDTDELSSHSAVPKRADQPAGSSRPQTEEIEKPRASPRTEGLNDPGRAPKRADQQAQTAELAQSHADRLTAALNRRRADKNLATQPAPRATPSARAGSEKPAAHSAGAEAKPPPLRQPTRKSTRPQTANDSATGSVAPEPSPPISQPAKDSQRPQAQTLKDHLAPAPTNATGPTPTAPPSDAATPTATALPSDTAEPIATKALEPNTKQPISPPVQRPSAPHEHSIADRLAGWLPQWIWARRAEILGAVVIGLVGVLLTLLYSTFRTGGAPETAATIGVDQAAETRPAETPPAIAQSPGPTAEPPLSAPPIPPLPVSPTTRDTPPPATDAASQPREAQTATASDQVPEAQIATAPAVELKPETTTARTIEPEPPIAIARAVEPRPQITTAPAVEPEPQVATAAAFEPEPQITTAAAVEPVAPPPAEPKPVPQVANDGDTAQIEDAAAEDETLVPVPDPNFLAELEATGETLRAQAAELGRQADLRAAELALQQGRLTSPPEASAYALYSRVLAQDPNSPEAQKGLKSVRAELINRAFAQLAGNQLDDARLSLAAAAESGANPTLVADLSAEVDFRQWRLDTGAGRFETLYPADRLVAVRQEPPELPSSVPSGSASSLEVQFTVTERGQVQNVAVLGNPPNDLERAVRRAVRDWRFEPVLYEGQPMTVRSSTRVNFAD